MKQINLKSDRVAALLEQLTRRTGETKVEAVTKALEERLRELEAKDRAARTLVWLRTVVWPDLPKTQHGRGSSKKEQEELLGF